MIAAALRAVFATLGRAVPKNAALPAAPAPTLKSLLTPRISLFPAVGRRRSRCDRLSDGCNRVQDTQAARNTFNQNMGNRLLRETTCLSMYEAA